MIPLNLFFFLSLWIEKVYSMAIKERKGIKKSKNYSFIKEYDYEILIVVLIALGVFLLVEDLEIKHYMYLGLRWFLFSIGDIIKIIRDNLILLFQKMNTIDTFISLTYYYRNSYRLIIFRLHSLIYDS